jgi:hypothetical protein
MSTRFKAFLAAAAILALPTLSWAAQAATSCCCPLCCH